MMNTKPLNPKESFKTKFLELLELFLNVVVDELNIRQQIKSKNIERSSTDSF